MLNIIREMQIKTTMKYCLTGQNGQCQEEEIASVGEDAEKKKLSCTVGGNVNW